MPFLFTITIAIVLCHLFLAFLPWIAAAVAAYVAVRTFLYFRRTRRLLPRQAPPQQPVLMSDWQMRRVRKCVAMLGSPRSGERQAALSALDRMLAAEGVTYGQLADILGADLRNR